MDPWYKCLNPRTAKPENIAFIFAQAQLCLEEKLLMTRNLDIKVTTALASFLVIEYGLMAHLYKTLANVSIKSLISELPIVLPVLSIGIAVFKLTSALQTKTYCHRGNEPKALICSPGEYTTNSATADIEKVYLDSILTYQDFIDTTSKNIKIKAKLLDQALKLIKIGTISGLVIWVCPDSIIYSCLALLVLP